MLKLFDEVASLDERCYEEFGLSEDILMEHAADGMASYIRTNFAKGSDLLIVTGSGNNGADGITLARLLHKDYNVGLFLAKEAKSPMAKLQLQRAEKIGIKPLKEILKKCDVVVEAIVGTGFKGSFNDELSDLILQLNDLKAYKIACDMPSPMFKADRTGTMGALKKSMFLDGIKDYVGEIEVVDLGVSRDIYEGDSSWFLLEYDDMKLPYRSKQNTHKGSFGHLGVISGEKIGASILTALSGLKFGAGLVTMITHKNNANLNIPPSIMSSNSLPKNTTAVAIGMGLGDDFSFNELKSFLHPDICIVGDADIFYNEIIFELLKHKKIVLTPHPKEFCSLLKMVGIADISTNELHDSRFEYVEMFCKKYPDAVLLLKGANVIIGKSDTYYVNSFGDSKLSKGGSGDVLSGLIGAMLAQGYDRLDAAITASLAHTKISKEYKGSSFSMTPQDLIDGINHL